MKKLILDAIESSGDLSAEVIILRLCAAALIAGFIFLSYRLSHDGSIYSSKFNVSLVVLTLITTTVMIVIGNHISLSLGMVGALSIVRFRTAVKDSRDAIYIFWCITVGICCGAGDYVVASCGSVLIFAASPVRKDQERQSYAADHPHGARERRKGRSAYFSVF